MRNVFLLLICLAIMFGTGVQADESPLPKDPILDKPVTLAVKGEALSDILPMLEKQTGARLRVTKDIADQKATIFVDAKPLRDVMKGIETLFQFWWSFKELKGKRTYELSMTEKVRKARAAASGKAWTEAYQEMDAEIKRLAQLPLEVPDGNGLTGAGWKRLRERESIVLAKYYSTLPEEVRQAFVSGCEIHFDTRSSEPEWKLPEDFVRELVETERKLHERWSDSVAYDMEKVLDAHLKLETVYQDKHFHASGYLDLHTTDTTYLDTSVTPILYDKNIDYLPKDVFSLPMEPLDSKFEKIVPFTPKEIAGEVGITGRTQLSKNLDTGESLLQLYVNRSDILAIIHNRVGLQIIADHYSKWSVWNVDTGITAKDVLDTLKDFDDFWNGTPKVTWGWDGSIVYMRSVDHLGEDEAEIPNRIIRPLQKSFAARGYLELDDLAQIELLTEKQRERLIPNMQSFGLEAINPVTKKTEPIRSLGSPLLRFYALLSPMQKKQIIGMGIHVDQLDQEQFRAILPLLGLRKSVSPNNAGIKVGIYKDGWRMDKPDYFVYGDLSDLLLFVRKQVNKMILYPRFDKNSVGTGTISLDRLNQRMSMFKKANPKVNIKNSFEQAEILYSLEDANKNLRHTIAVVSTPPIPCTEDYFRENEKSLQ